MVEVAPPEDALLLRGRLDLRTRWRVVEVALDGGTPCMRGKGSEDAPCRGGSYGRSLVLMLWRRMIKIAMCLDVGRRAVVFCPLDPVFGLTFLASLQGEFFFGSCWLS